MVAGRLRRNHATGRAKRNHATGRAKRSTATSTGCCCGCADCGAISPSAFHCSFAGITLSQGCTNAGSFLEWMFIVQNTLAGTFTLTHPVADPFGRLDPNCVWTYGETPGVTVAARAYRSAGTCTSGFSGDYGFYIRLSRISLGLGSGQFLLEAWLGDSNAIQSDLFVASIVTADCGSGGSFTPNLNYTRPKGNGGTATLTPA